MTTTQQTFDTAAVIIMHVVNQAMNARELGFEDAVAFVADESQQTVEEVEANLFRALMVLATSREVV